MPAIPSCTVEGAFGIERTTGTSVARWRSIAAVGIAAATRPPGVAYPPGVVARQPADAREPRPFPAGGGELARLRRLDAPAPQLGGQLHEPEVAREPALVAPETLQAHDADRPRSEAA